MTHTADASAPDLARIRDVLGPMPRVLYHPPHLYPITAPNFVEEPGAERVQPSAGRLRLYVHVPFCRYKCSFCFYALRVGAKDPSMDRYVAALERELQWIEPGTALAQVFIGGGTPTALPPPLFDRLLGAVFERTRPIPGEIHTCEASPETVTAEHIAAMKRHGVQRVSMGIQSLDEGVLHGIHRRHSAEEALKACRLLVASGLIVNVDLIYGLPGQTEVSFRTDLHTLAAEGIDSFSLYNLRTNEETSVTRKLQPDELLGLRRLVGWRTFILREIAEMGFEAYRWHGFRRKTGHGDSYERAPCFSAKKGGYRLGVGMSARSKLGLKVYQNCMDFKGYVEAVEAGRSPVDRVMHMDEGDVRGHIVARTLGDGKPLWRAGWEEAFGRPLDADYPELLPRLVEAGLLEDDGARVALSPHGILVYDLLTIAFFPQRAKDWLAERQRLLCSL